MSYSSIRILPMSKNEFQNRSHNEVQQDFFLKQLPAREHNNNKGLYCFKKFAFAKDTPLDNNTLILFQYKARIIATAELKNIVYLNKAQGDYTGYFILNRSSICIFNPIDSSTLSNIFNQSIKFCQARHKLDVSKYNKFNSSLINKFCIDMSKVNVTEPLKCMP